MVLLTVLVFFIVSSVDCFAEAGWYEKTGESFVNVVNRLRSGISAVARVLMLIGSAGALVFAIINLMEGEREGAKRFMIWLVGLLIGFIAISILKDGPILPNRDVSNGAGSGVSSFISPMRSLMSVLLYIVAIITVVSKVFQVINGEKDGGRQLFKWFVVTLVGMVLLNVL